MCSYIVEKAKLLGSAKGPNGWMRIDTANVYYDHPFHSPLDHALGIDFINEAEDGAERGFGPMPGGENPGGPGQRGDGPCDYGWSQSLKAQAPHGPLRPARAWI